MMNEKSTIYKNLISALQNVIDPETGADVIRMRLIENLVIQDNGTAEYQFRPSSPLCPLAVTLVMQIIEVVQGVQGITNQRVKVVDYIGAEELNKFLGAMLQSNQKPHHSPSESFNCE